MGHNPEVQVAPAKETAKILVPLKKENLEALQIATAPKVS